MKDVFKELEVEVAQYVVDRKHDAIERKNLLIANDNLIDECLSKEVFFVATNSELNVARFTEMTIAHTAVEAQCLELEAELAKLYRFGNNPSTPDNDTPDVDSVFVIGKMQASLQGKDNVIRQLKKKISQLKKQVTFAKQSDKSGSNTHKHVVKVKTQKTNVHVPPSTGVDSFPNASGSQPKSNIKTNRISPAKGVNKLPVEDQPMTNKSYVRTSNRVDSSSRLKRT
nr:hypothetical protein [Tanacetum cinerariifolium]